MSTTVNGQTVWMRVRNGLVQFCVGVRQQWLDEQVFAAVYPDLYTKLEV